MNNKGIQEFISPRRTLQEYVLEVKKIGIENLKKPENKNLREKFQAALLIFGICDVTGRNWWIRLIEEKRPDFEACSRSRGGRFFDCAVVENVQIPKYVAEETDNFSPSGIAKFISDKKLSHVGNQYDDSTIFGVYLNYCAKKGVLFDEIALEINKVFSGRNEVWMHGSLSQNSSRWFVAKVYPAHTHSREFNVPWDNL